MHQSALKILDELAHVFARKRHVGIEPLYPKSDTAGRPSISRKICTIFRSIWSGI